MHAGPGRQVRLHPPSHARSARAVQHRLLRSSSSSCRQIRHSRTPGRSSSPVACPGAGCCSSGVASPGSLRARCSMPDAAQLGRTHCTAAAPCSRMLALRYLPQMIQLRRCTWRQEVQCHVLELGGMLPCTKPEREVAAWSIMVPSKKGQGQGDCSSNQVYQVSLSLS
jgi:hypothetical protein